MLAVLSLLRIERLGCVKDALREEHLMLSRENVKRLRIVVNPVTVVMTLILNQVDLSDNK